jgi:hypothetical protein
MWPVRVREAPFLESAGSRPPPQATWLIPVRHRTGRGITVAGQRRCLTGFAVARSR